MSNDARGRPPGCPDDRPQDAPASANHSVALNVAPGSPAARSASAERHRRQAAQLAAHEQDSMRELEELFDRRNDGLAAGRRFRERLAWHCAVFGDGTVRTSPVLILAEMTRAERRLQRARGGAR